ncbi:MAG TPA: EAL domain-containing protein [Geminicoccus sp.]|jgi:diguanylate cyclase (GGDEF)-like protein|uniref:two-component system response regulator n=1 Tax=Geminicoccus sp. TaxID=2024832 RepID=UPI002E372EFF|nr:EAL domain-containing protein [Geminicoccus sp.]HEX2525241.1 EAL domain-containing protein [Geminicoccus sp.]
MAKIVVIDDRVTNRNILSRLAQSVEEGLVVQAYGSPTEALAAITATEAPDLVVTDFNMPGMNGAELIRELRTTAGCELIPIIVVTVYEDRDYCYQALESGATDFLLSPVDHLEFRARVKNLLTMRRQQRLLSERAADLEQRLGTKGAGAALSIDPAALCGRLELPAFVTDQNARLVAANAAWARAAGCATLPMPGDQGRQPGLDALLGAGFLLRYRLQTDKIFETGEASGQPRVELIGQGQQERRVLLVHAPLTDAAGQVSHVLTLWHEGDELLRSMADTMPAMRSDALTGLPSGQSLLERIAQDIARTEADQELLALVHIDIDRFKSFNNAYGDAFGSALLKALAGRLRGRVKAGETLGRLRSDEFLIAHPGLRRADEAAELCRRLNETFAEPFQIGDREINVSASMGVTIWPDDARQLDHLLRNAELAMHRAKQSGRDTWRFFAEEMNVTAKRTIQLERELRQALTTRQFTVHYQPQMELGSGRIIGVEALVRWNHPSRGMVRPGEFLQVAEDIGLIAPLSNWVLQQACRQLRLWQEQGIEGITMSVNIGPGQFREKGVERQIEQLLAETGIDPCWIDIELTENALFENTAQAMETLRFLAGLGVSLSLDDFGTGYSSLAYLQRLPVHRLKIDRQFVHDIETNEQSRQIVHMVVELARSLGLTVLAEGVETPGQRLILERGGCDQIQGHLVGFPMPPEEVEALLRAVPASVAP